MVNYISTLKTLHVPTNPTTQHIADHSSVDQPVLGKCSPTQHKIACGMCRMESAENNIYRRKGKVTGLNKQTSLVETHQMPCSVCQQYVLCVYVIHKNVCSMHSYFGVELEN